MQPREGLAGRLGHLTYTADVERESLIRTPAYLRIDDMHRRAQPIAADRSGADCVRFAVGSEILMR
jgi:hypothetical protein